MICQQVGGCGGALPPGAAHINLESCVQFLLSCRVCGGEGAVPIHPRCLATAAAQRGAQAGVSVAERKIVDSIAGWLSGRRHPDDTDPPNENAGSDIDDDQRRGSRKNRGKRFEP